MIGLEASGSFDKTLKFLNKLTSRNPLGSLDKYGHLGVRALASATPEDTGDTANSWDYKIVKSGDRIKIEWFNTNVVDGSVIAVLIQYGHGTGTGGWVEGRDYINPAMRPIFDNIADSVWKEVNR